MLGISVQVMKYFKDIKISQIKAATFLFHDVLFYWKGICTLDMWGQSAL